MNITNLLPNMIVLSFAGEIQTNTPAFHEYAYQKAFSNAHSLAMRWRLDQSVVTSNNVTRFMVHPHPDQIDTTMEFGGRYTFWTSKSGFLCFSDKEYRVGADLNMWTNHPLADRYGSDLAQKLDRPGSLDQISAQKIAESAIASYGVSMSEMRFYKPKNSEQLRLGDHTLSYFEFMWESEKGRCKVDVSGSTTNVVKFEFKGPKERRGEPPSNYHQLLGLPTNAIFVKPISQGAYQVYEGNNDDRK